MANEITLIYEARIATVQLLEQLFRHIEATRGHRFRSVQVSEVRAGDLTSDTFPLLARLDGIEAYRLARALRKANIAYGYYLDDNFWEIDGSLPIGRYYGLPSVRRRLAGIIRGASLILVATPALKEYLAEFGERVRVVDSFFDFKLIPELPPPPANHPIVRGGFASSVERAADLVPLMQELVETLDAHPNLEFEILGAQRHGIRSHSRIHWLPYVSGYDAYVRFLGGRQWDFAIAPLADTPANRYKTDNKYREYAAQGIPGIYQDMPPYRAVSDEKTGLLVGPGRRSWREAIERYLGVPELRLRVREAARADAERRLSIEAVTDEWLEELAPMPGVSVVPRVVRRAMSANRRQIPDWLHVPRNLADAALVSMHVDGPRATARQAFRFVGRKLAHSRPSERRSTIDRVET